MLPDPLASVMIDLREVQDLHRNERVETVFVIKRSGVFSTGLSAWMLARARARVG